MIDEKVLMFWLQNKSIEYLATAFKGVDPDKAKAKIELIGEIISEFKLSKNIEDISYIKD